MKKKTASKDKPMTIYAASKKFGVGVERLRRAAHDGRLPADIQSVEATRIMVKAADVRDYIDRTGFRKSTNN